MDTLVSSLAVRQLEAELIFNIIPCAKYFYKTVNGPLHLDHQMGIAKSAHIELETTGDSYV